MVAVTFLLDSNPFQSLLPEASLLLVLRGMCPEGQLAVPSYLTSEDSEMTPGPSGGWLAALCPQAWSPAVHTWASCLALLGDAQV